MKRWWGLWLLACLLAPAGAQVEIKPDHWAPQVIIAPDQTVMSMFTLTNTGDEPVEVLSVLTDEGIETELDRTTLPPGDFAVLKAKFTPAPDAEREVQETVELAIVVTLDSRQDRLTIPIEFTLAPSKPKPSNVLPAPVLHGVYEPRQDDQPVSVELFYNSGCGTCQSFLDRVIDPLKKHFAEAPVTWNMHDTMDEGVPEQLEEMKARYAVTEVSNIHLFVGKHAVTGAVAGEEQLYTLLKMELRAPTEPPAPVVATGQQMGPQRPGAKTAPPGAKIAPPGAKTESLGGSLMRGRFEKLAGPAVLLAGLVDGFNPCAFATAVFLIVMLTRLGHDRRTLLIAGAAFAGAVYATYYLLGLGVLQWLTQLSDQTLWLSRTVNYGVAALALFFAGVQVVDVLRLKRGAATRELSGQLPLRVKQAIHGLLRKNLARPIVALGAVAAGVAVTVLEAVCTGQVYLPILWGLRSEELRARAYGLLALYNAGFVLPLLIVIGLAYTGVTTERLAKLANRYLPQAKLALAILLVGLAVFLLWPHPPTP